MFIRERGLERERERAVRQECVCAHVPHETRRSNLSLERESERERGDAEEANA